MIYLVIFPSIIIPISKDPTHCWWEIGVVLKFPWLGFFYCSFFYFWEKETRIVIYLFTLIMAINSSYRVKHWLKSCVYLMTNSRIPQQCLTTLIYKTYFPWEVAFSENPLKGHIVVPTRWHIPCLIITQLFILVISIFKWGW